MKTADLIPYVKNQKKHPKKQVKEIAESIKAFGFTQPIVIDSKNEIIIGHGRVMAAQLLELEKVPVLVRDDLSEQQVKALRIADNKLNESPWDKELLKTELSELYDEEFDMSSMGYDISELQNLGVGIDPDAMAEDFSLPSGDKSPFQQMTFTLSDQQAEVIHKALARIKRTNAFKNSETHGNKNRNGNALFVLVEQWAEQKK